MHHRVSTHSLPLYFLVLLYPMYPIYLAGYGSSGASVSHAGACAAWKANACAVVEHRARQLAATGASRRGSPRSSSKAGSFRLVPSIRRPRRVVNTFRKNTRFSLIVHSRRSAFPPPGPSLPIYLVFQFPSSRILDPPIFLRSYLFNPEDSLGGVGWTLMHVRIARTVGPRVFLVLAFRVNHDRVSRDRCRKLAATLTLSISRP